METKDFESITIAELVRKAGVSRQSFYRNYSSKEDVVIEIEEGILATIADSLEDPKYAGNLRRWICDIFRAVKKNQKLIRVLQKAKLFDILFSKVPFVIENWMGKDSAHLHYYIVGSLGALRSIGEEWFVSGMKESCQKMADLCMSYDLDRLLLRDATV